MKQISLAYLCGEYPRATDTFIQREVAALRRAGLTVETIAVRRPSLREQGTAEQEEERRRTHYLLPSPPWRLLADHLGLVWQGPGRYLRAIRLALGVRAPGVRALIYQLFYFAEAGMVAARMRRLGLRHVHNHAPDSSGYVAMLAAELADLSYSMTIHGFGILAEPGRWRLREKIEQALFTICISDYARSQAMLWSQRSCWPHLHVVHCGIEPHSVTARHHEGRGQRLLYVGRFDHVKGLPLLLEAFATLAGDDPALHLDMVGDGPERQDLLAMVAELGLQERITFHGYHSQAQLQDDYDRADLFVLTSFVEGIPVVLMEAMAQGVPVVAPRITGVPELVDDGVNGLLYTPGVVEQLVARCEKVLADPDLRNSCAAAARKTVQHHFNLDSETSRLAEIMQHYLQEGPDQAEAP